MDRGTVGSANRGRLQVEARTEGISEVVTPVGETDHHTADLLREPLESAVEQGRSRLVVDCSRLEFCDSTGLNVLLGARLKAEAAAWRGSPGRNAARGGEGVRDHRRGGGLHRPRHARRGPGHLTRYERATADVPDVGCVTRSCASSGCCCDTAGQETPRRCPARAPAHSVTDHYLLNGDMATWRIGEVKR